jgi:DNA (cytosine-5)-methyltransferase 1
LEQAGLFSGEFQLLIGGPPCQPFSKAAYWANGETQRANDPRAETLSAYLSYVKELLPEVLLLENVRGLAYKNKDEGLQLLKDGLDEINQTKGTCYQPNILHLNAASFGAPQLRERTFVIAHRGGVQFKSPAPTHMDPYKRHRQDNQSQLLPWATTWDAIGDLDHVEVDAPELQPSGKWADLLPSIPEGENYLWHTAKRGGEPLFGWRTRFWSFLLKLAKDRPSWTIPAQPGPATGPFHWRNRRLSVRELARLQTFPDSYQITGLYREAHHQLGNAVPPALGEMLGLEIRAQLLSETQVLRPLTLIPSFYGPPTPPEPVASVPEKYQSLRGAHSAHPGPGRGPGARKRAQETV